MNELKPFDDKLSGLLESLSPAGRRKMASDIAKKLRASQQQRIKRQKAPDGTPYASRKRQPVRGQRGRVKREMFAKLRTARYLKTKGSSEAAVVEFAGRVQRIARIHQEGLADRPNKQSALVRYEVRHLLGFSNTDYKMVEAILLSHFDD